MFYSVFVLGKKGPLARVWLAAHWDKKITKAQILETNIVESVDSILQPRVKLSLRTSSHLLLGIVRIYARKTLYLLQDCQDAAFKIKSAFRPGAVDLPDGKTEAAISAITLPEMLDFVNDFDLLAEPPVQIEPLQTNTNIRSITLVEDIASMPVDVPLFGEGKEWNEFSSIQVASTSKISETSTQEISQKQTSHPLDIFDRPTVDDGFGGPVGLTDVDDMFALPVPPEAQQQMQAEADAAEEREKGEEPERPLSRLSDRSDRSSMSYGAPPSIAPSGPSSPGSPPPMMNQDQEMQDIPPIIDENPVPNEDKQGIDDLQGPEDLEAIRAEQNIFRRPETQQESMVLEPLEGSGFERKRKRRKKLGIIIDEVKTLSGEEMKSQLSDTSDIVTTLDIAPPTKKLMHWKRTGGSEKLFALSEKPIPSKVLLVYYTRHLVTTRISVEEELPEDMIPEHMEEPQPQEEIREMHEQIQQNQPEEIYEPILPPISPLKEIQPPKTPRTPRREPPEHKSPVKKKRKTADERETEKKERRSKAVSHEPPPEKLPNNISDHINDTGLSELREGSIQSPDRAMSAPSISLARSSNFSIPQHDFDEDEPFDQYEQPMSVGPPEEMMPDETAEQYEERMRNKRTNVLLRLMSKQLEDGDVTFGRLVSHNRRKQVAQKFFSLLVLKKQQAVELTQDISVPYGEILITKGYRYDEALAACAM